MLKNLSIKNNTRKRFNNDNCLNIFIKIEIVFYKTIQKISFKFIFFVHHNRTRQLYVNVNAFYERDFDVIIFHVKNDKKYLLRTISNLYYFLAKYLR